MFKVLSETLHKEICNNCQIEEYEQRLKELGYQECQANFLEQEKYWICIEKNAQISKQVIEQMAVPCICVDADEVDIYICLDCLNKVINK